MIFRSAVFAIMLIMFSTPAFSQPYSAGPRQTGEEVLEELLIGGNSLCIRVASNGCTGKGSFRIDVRKEEGITPKAPHYVLTVNRITPDECKAMIGDGTVIYWELEKDLGLKGNFTFSVRNRAYSVSRGFPSDDDNSLISTLKKHIAMDGLQGPGKEPKK